MAEYLVIANTLKKTLKEDDGNCPLPSTDTQNVRTDFSVFTRPLSGSIHSTEFVSITGDSGDAVGDSGHRPELWHPDRSAGSADRQQSTRGRRGATADFGLPERGRETRDSHRWEHDETRFHWTPRW